MNENTKKLIDDLKTIVRDLHRSAGKLDEMIQQIEMLPPNIVEDVEHFRIYLTYFANQRKDQKRICYGNLENLENLTWKELLESLKEEA